MTNESNLTLDEFKKQIIRQIKLSSPNVEIDSNSVDIKVKLTEDSEPVDFYSLKIVVNV